VALVVIARHLLFPRQHHKFSANPFSVLRGEKAEGR
jgi:hypothetical protein